MKIGQDMQPLFLYRKNGLYLNRLPQKGRGVFCKEFIAAGEVIEVTPAYILPEEDVEQMFKTDLVNYCFSGNKFSRHVHLWSNVRDGSKAICLSLGVTSICNHLADPNAVYDQVEDRGMPFFILKAERDIPQDTEICVNYGISWFGVRRNRIKAE